jgi:plasmid stability protein
MEAIMTQITLRNVPDGVRHKLKLLAAQRHQSMNATAVTLLQESLGLKPSSESQRDLSAIAGSWSEEQVKEFEKNTAVFEQIDEELWG